MGFGNLRVINEDRVAAGAGFGTHGHKDMEIISYVLSGELAHKDSMGNVKSIPPGDVQRMSAGRGVTHSEFNHKADETTHFLQIWIEPKAIGIAPGYAQKAFSVAEKRGKLRLVASPDGAEGSVDDECRCAVFSQACSTATSRPSLALDPARKSYVHLVRGEVSVNGQTLAGGDAALLAEESVVRLAAGRDAEVLVFDLAA
jgi:quercetin 2,3-dioxygenase